MFSNPVLVTDATLFWSPLFAHDPLRGFMVLFVALLVAALFCAILGFGSGFLSCRFVIRSTVNRARWIRAALITLCVVVSLGVAGVAFLPSFRVLCAAFEGKGISTAFAPAPRPTPQPLPAPRIALDPPTRSGIPPTELQAIEDARQAKRQLENGGFQDELTGWNLEEAGNTFHVFRRDDQPRVTSYGAVKEAGQGRIYQCFTVPEAPTTLRFFVHGGHDPRALVVALWAGEQRIDRVTGKNDNECFEVRWDLSKWQGQTITLEIRDDKQGPWGFIGAHGFELLPQEEATENQ